jgi:hypothetical protein
LTWDWRDLFKSWRDFGAIREIAPAIWRDSGAIYPESRKSRTRHSTTQENNRAFGGPVHHHDSQYQRLPKRVE